MNWQHLQTFIWLRWRILANQWQRGGIVNAILTMILVVGLLVTAIPLFFVCLLLGLTMFPKAEPVHLLYAWDGMIVGFVLLWTVGLLTELQRTDTLSPTKFLHLPLSVAGVFFINYASSLVCVSLILFTALLVLM